MHNKVSVSISARLAYDLIVSSLLQCIKDNKFRCYYCNKPGHLKRHCQKKNDFARGQMKSMHANVAERGEEEEVGDFAFVALHNQSTKSISWYSTQVHLTTTSVIETGM